MNTVPHRSMAHTASVGALALVPRVVSRLLVRYMAGDESKADEKNLLAGSCQFEQFNAQAEVC